MVTKTINIRIPDWVYRYRYSNLKKYAKWLLFPSRCDVCGKKVNFRAPNIDHRDRGNRKLMTHWYFKGPKTDSCICRDCLASYVDVVEPANPWGHEWHEWDLHKTCDICHEDATAYKSFKIKTSFGTADFRFCVLSWNSSFVCQSCVASALRNGEETSDIHAGYKKGDKYFSVPQNEFGLPVIDGKVRFPI